MFIYIFISVYFIAIKMDELQLHTTQVTQICFSIEARNKKIHYLWFHLCRVKSKHIKIKTRKMYTFHACVYFMLTPNMPVLVVLHAYPYCYTSFQIHLEIFWFWI